MGGQNLVRKYIFAIFIIFLVSGVVLLGDSDELVVWSTLNHLGGVVWF